jgi:UDP-sugar transporter A1/2/3
MLRAMFKSDEKEKTQPPAESDTKRVFIQVLIIVLLVFQSCSYVLIRRYVQNAEEVRTDSNLILLAGEFEKFTFSLFVILISNDECTQKTFSEFLSGGAVMLVPAGAYLVMNLLSFFCLQYISASIFITVAQCKTLTTALSSVFILKTSLSKTKWLSLFILVFGSIMVTRQEHPQAHGGSPSSLPEESASYQFYLGLLALLMEISISGLISAYYEKILKGYRSSVWERNLQLAFLSMLMYYGNYQYQHLYDEDLGVLYTIVDWDWRIHLTSFLGAAGGILVALCMKYLNAVVKCVVLSFSVIVTVFLSHLFFYSTLTAATLFGAILVVSGSIIFNQSEAIENLLLKRGEPIR